MKLQQDETFKESFCAIDKDCREKSGLHLWHGILPVLNFQKLIAFKIKLLLKEFQLENV